MAKDRYEFGQNWKNYLKKVNEKRLEEVEKSLKDFIELENFKGKTFLDIGCGSGVFSLSAHKLGANVFSFDVDKDSVECCKFLWEKEGKPKNWKIMYGSVLDKLFLKKLPKADIVYSWGVLHHTGKMYEAISNAASLVKNNGLFYISIYNKVKSGVFSSKNWLKMKKIYSSSGPIVRKLFEGLYVLLFFAKNVLTLKNPVRKVKEYNERGMNWYNDVKDWLGGYPYEFASVEEISDFCEKLGLHLVKVRRVGSLATNEFLFVKK